MDTEIESVRSFLNKNNIHINLRYFGAHDFSANFDIQCMDKNHKFFESLFARYQSCTVDDLNIYYYFILIRKISKMKELVPLIANHDCAELLKRITDEADNDFKQKKGSAVTYINGHKDDIFGHQQPDFEIKYASLDFMMECLAGIDYSTTSVVIR